MPTTIQLRHVETDRFLGWLTDVLKRSEAVSLEVHVVEDGSQSCSIEINLRGVPAPLIDGGATAAAAQRFPPQSDKKQLEIFG